MVKRHNPVTNITKEAKMRPYVSSTVFEIIDGEFVYRGWDVRGDHMYHESGPPQTLHFGETGITLCLVDGKPKLTIPEGRNAELLQSDYAFKDGQRVDGKFVEVRIH